MSRYLVPFWAAAASGKKVSFNRSANTATIGTTTYSTADPTPIASVSANASSIAEGSNAVWMINLSRPAQSQVTVRFSVTQTGDFVRSQDLGNKRVRINAGNSSARYRARTINDSENEFDGEATLTLTSVDQGYAIATNKSSIIVIRDNDGSGRGVEDTSKRFALGDGNWIDVTRRTESDSNNDWYVLEGSRNIIRRFAPDGTENINGRTVIPARSTWTGMWYLSNPMAERRRWVLLDDTNNQLRFFRLTGNEDSQQRINLGTGDWRGLYRTSNRWAIIELRSSRSADIKFFNFSGTEQTSERIYINIVGSYGGLWRTNDRWVIQIGSFLYFFLLTGGSHRSSERIRLPDAPQSGLYLADNRWVVITQYSPRDLSTNRLRFYGA